MMKKLTIAVLCVILMLSMLLPGALADNRELVRQPDGAVPSLLDVMLTVGDELLLFVRESDGDGITDAVYRWSPGMEDAERIASGVFISTWCATAEELEQFVSANEKDKNIKIDREHVLTGVFTDGERLMGYNAITGALLEIRFADGQAVYEKAGAIKDTSFLFHREADSVWLANCRGIAAVDGRVVFLMWDYDTGREFTRLVSVDMASGDVTISKQENVQSLAAGKDGQLLLVSRDNRNAYDEKTDTWVKPVLSRWDPAADTATEITKLDTNDSAIRLTYSKALDAILYVENSRVMALKEGQEAKQVGYLPITWTNMLCAVGDSVAIEHDQREYLVKIRTVSWDYNEEDRLLISGTNMDMGGRLFNSRFPQVPLYCTADYYTRLEELSQAMSAGEKAPDVIELNMGYSKFDTLVRKGYCEDLSGDKDIAAYIDRLYPCLREAVTRDGKLYAVPLWANSSNGWYAANGVMEEMGLTWEDIPKNFVDLCAFITRWNDEWVDEFPQFAPMEYTEDYKQTILGYMMDGYMAYCQQQGRDVRFNTPEFQAMMDALEAMRVDKLEKGVARENEDEVGYRQGLLMHGYGLVGTFNLEDEYRRFIPMALTADIPFMTGADVTVMFINPKSTHKEMALSYIKCQVEALSDSCKRVLLADETEPVRNLYYDQMIAGEEAWLKTLEEKLATADDAEKKELESAIEAEKKWLSEAEDNFYYSISPEQLAFYQKEIAPVMFVRKPTFLNGADSVSDDLTSLVDRYLAGQIKLDQFIKGIDSKLQMMQMEDW